MKIQGRTFAISGGASGLGRALARSVVSSGGNVAILDLNPDLASPLIKELTPARAIFIECDVSSTEDISSAVQKIKDWISETKYPLGGIIPAAGVGRPGLIIDKTLTPASISSIDFLLSINLRGTLDLTRQLLPLLASVNPPLDADGERGVVIMVASSAAFEGQMGQVAYAASKGAVASMTLPMARDLSRFGIRVVTIAPSMFDSAMTAVMSDKVRKGLEKAMEFPVRAGKPEEFAALAKHAIENPMLNGVVIRLDGATRMPSKL
ncbi:3-hydroxyacyl-CoA dehydrogenase type-2 [Cladorrhinum sp. PSN332]|nr:3-hydroxyacyl-CoA dehydrogenase type-2 [Cladorrhinum sp. PSN332]